MKNIITFALLLILLQSCATFGVRRIKNLPFDRAHGLTLDVYASDKITQPKKVIVFVHGGRWKTGRKSQYKFLGNRLAHKGLVAVIVDYRLSPEARYNGMATDVAKSISWVKENIMSYGGDPQHIFVAGHSAGGHLAALVSADQRYLNALDGGNALKGTILIDAFGLDMYKFLSNEKMKKNPVYYAVFGKDSVKWKDGSPRYHLGDRTPPTLLFVGGKTFPVIVEDSEEYQEALKTSYPATQLITIPKKSHIPMILQFYNKNNKAYREIINFINSNSGR